MGTVNEIRLRHIEDRAWSAAEYPSGSEARKDFLSWIDREIDDLKAEGVEKEELEEAFAICSNAFNERRVQVLDADPGWYHKRLWRDIRTLSDWPGIEEPDVDRA